MSRAIVRCERSWSSQFWAARIAGTPMQRTVAAAAAVTLLRLVIHAIRSRMASTPNPIQIEKA